MSLPTRERGLKSAFLNRRIKFYIVAPYTGAWIEMRAADWVNEQSMVAPYTGAWIEIVACRVDSLLVRVAPYTGAWIEIYGIEPILILSMSLPTRERGLKFRCHSLLCDNQ